MARSPRLVVPGHPVHLIHRGNNRQAVFFGEGDYHRFLSDVTRAAGKPRCAVHASVLICGHDLWSDLGSGMSIDLFIVPA